MKTSCLPLGFRPQTEEQILEMDRREKLYEYYGIPYGIFDDIQHNENSEIEKDRTTAQLLIMQGENIPKDLEERLLFYKQQDAQNKKDS